METAGADEMPEDAERKGLGTPATRAATILCFANGELYEIVPIPQGKETMICQLLRQPQKDADKCIVVVDDAAQIEMLDIPQVAGFCTVAEDGTVSYYKKEAAFES